MGKKGKRLQRLLPWRRQSRVSHHGGIEHLLPGRILGWALAKKNTFHEVRLLVGPQLIARAEINQPRPDVCKQYACESLPGFSLPLPEQLPELDWRQPTRLIAISVDAGFQCELKLLTHPGQSEARLKSLLQSNVLGMVGHFDGVVNGALQGWAARSHQQQAAQVWLQSKNHEPIPVICDQWREGMAAHALPNNCGFRLNLGQLPTGWEGTLVWCSFDREGTFLLPQNQPIHTPARPLNRAPEAENPTAVATYQPALSSAPEELGRHWQALEDFRLFLDALEHELDRRDSLPPVQQQPEKSPGWLRRLMGGS